MFFRPWKRAETELEREIAHHLHHLTEEYVRQGHSRHEAMLLAKHSASAVDAWVGANPSARAFAQVGPSSFAPRHLEWQAFVAADECRRRVAEADLVVAHAGMGSIITALELGRPIVVMPRRAELGEHRNDHQLATVRHLATSSRLAVADDEASLATHLQAHLQSLSAGVAQSARVGRHASPRLLSCLRTFLDRREGAGDAGVITPMPVSLGLDLPVDRMPSAVGSLGAGVLQPQ